MCMITKIIRKAVVRTVAVCSLCLWPASASYALFGTTGSHTSPIDSATSTLGVLRDKTLVNRQQLESTRVSSDSVEQTELCDSTLLTLPRIRSVVNEELRGINKRLETIERKVTPRGFLNRIRSEAPTKALWDFMVKPIVSWLLALVGSLSFVSKIAVCLHLRKARQQRRPAPIAARIDAAITIVWYVLILLLILEALAWIFITPSSVDIPTNPNPEIVSRLDHIEDTLKSLSPETPNPPNNINPLLAVVSICSLLGLIALAVFRSRHNDPIWHVPMTSSSQPISDTLGAQLVTPVVLALILLLLPSPVDTFLLPFLVSYFIAAFLDLLYFYPDPALLRIVLRHYKILIYLAYYGAWSGFFYTLRNFLYPIWSSIDVYALRNYSTIKVILDSVWQWWPMFFAVIAAVPGWLKVRRVAERDRIAGLRKLLDSQKVTEQAV